MAQTVVQSTASVKFGGTSSTVTRTLNGVTAGNRLEVLVEAWGQVTDPAVTVSDGTNTYTSLRSKNSANVNSRFEASLHYALNVGAGNYTVTVTHNGAANNKYGEVIFREVSGGLTTGAEDTGVTKSSTANTSTPSITATGATAQATNFIVALCGVNANTTDVGLDPASGNSLTWTNRIRDQDPQTEVGWSADDAPSSSSITPTCSWGTLTGTYDTAMLITAFKDAAAGGTNTQKTMTDTLTLTEQTVKGVKRGVVQTETMTMFDDPNRTIAVVADDMSIGTFDEEVDWLRLVRVSGDTLSLVDSTVMWRRLVRVMSESLTLLDSIIKVVSGSVVYTRVMSETIEFSDGFFRYLRYRRVGQDNLDIIDAFSKIIAGAGITYAKVMSDTVILGDDAGNRWKYSRTTTTDAITLNDAFSRWVRALRQMGDVLEIADGTVKIWNRVRAVSDTLDISDELIRSLFLDHLQPTNFVLGIGAEPFHFGMGRIL